MLCYDVTCAAWLPAAASSVPSASLRALFFSWWVRLLYYYIS